MAKMNWERTNKGRQPKSNRNAQDDMEEIPLFHGFHDVRFTFGKYKNKRVVEIWVKDHDYCLWIYHNIKYKKYDLKAVLDLLVRTSVGRKLREEHDAATREKNG